MPELRQNMATKEWVIIATERAKRPEDFAKGVEPKGPLPEFVETCPFCPGNEGKTPPEISRIAGGPKGWKVRVIPNKFAALSTEGERAMRFDGVNRSMTGVGIHEVIIESPSHSRNVGLLSDDEARDLYNVYLQRYVAIRDDPRVELVIIFRNHGSAAGTSLEHPHSQVIGVPLVPTHIRSRMEEAMRFFDDVGECVFCRMLADELRAKERLVIETEHFVSFVPYAAASPFHTWVLPRRHMAGFDKVTPAELEDLATHMRDILKKLHIGLNDPSLNYVIRSVPEHWENMPFFHWYVSIVPRLTKAAGFELGSGMYINIALPEASAKFLREVKI
ncbi:MAG: galactose-1-phosphate uridylyltransferase [Planctomycetota bacterium]|nr:galactose-1-phosphate uridylyltransferase [Planctomycetota bacterium]